ncbi:N-acetylmuramoyl-L-alanine amidase [Chelativorans sp. YIM 93263]|uniref:N-acetylmuramoyl-L-alanine amidase n=1 Tax=Chelativorans sp. YIM 93263 TaxID=2906648 RepID=UPI0023794361|nr:N-acetylmuramoyl-L-alanine amidase [Chelativorans sp. YIM 93263]
MSEFAPDYSRAHRRASPNFGPRRGGIKPKLLILHYTGMDNGQAAEDWLCSHESGVSAHYLVHEDGRIVQMVPEAARAWHAGKSIWNGASDVNSLSIGVEIANRGHAYGYPDFPEPQVEAVIALSRDICLRHRILPQNVLAHSDVAPGRKIDPGEKFPWDRLARAGVGHFVDPMAPDQGNVLSTGARGEPVLALQAMLALYGYGIEQTGVYDTATEIVVGAFQRHFRPARVDSIADSSTRDVLKTLLKTLPARAGD